MAEQEKLTPDGAEQESAAAEQAQQTQPVAAKKPGKPAPKQRKPGLFARIGKWLRELRSEGRKVIWPTKNQVINNTIVVIIMVIVVAAFVAVLDTVFGQVRDFLARLLS